MIVGETGPEVFVPCSKRLRYEAVLVFEGPIYKWNGKVDEREVIARRTFRWRWLAEGWAQGRLKGLSRCKYVINDTV